MSHNSHHWVNKTLDNASDIKDLQEATMLQKDSQGSLFRTVMTLNRRIDLLVERVDELEDELETSSKSKE